MSYVLERTLPLEDAGQEGSGWELRVQRGPNWLLVKVLQGRHRPPDDERLAERLWHLMEDHCAYRIVLELDELEAIDSAFVQQLGRLDGLARDHGGFLRLCGLSPRDWQLVVRHGLGDVFPPYRDRQEAVFASRGPRKPR